MIGDVKGDECIMIDINRLVAGLSYLELSTLRYNCNEVIRILEKKRNEELGMTGIESLASKRWDDPTKYMPFCMRLKGIFHRDLDFKNFEKENDRCFNVIAMILKSFACCSMDECSDEMQKLIEFFERIKAIAGDQHNQHIYEDFSNIISQPKPTTPPREQRYPIRPATSSGEHSSCTSSLFTVRDRGLNAWSICDNEEEAVTSLSSVPGPSQPVNLKK
ncbi:MAG: hypothetical protein A2X78_00535 [Gammaproteobacteria bacterium GWE2_37_16]|nr:MAG: hypothetical protein A2X78_00535 [Gammaproteobacteria bacterium GWE2_37_16]